LSPTLGRSFALALIADGRNRLGETLFATTMETMEAAKPVKLVEPVFYDKEGRRLEL
jgi:sarcosine oxidase subunit alpha